MQYNSGDILRIIKDDEVIMTVEVVYDNKRQKMMYFDGGLWLDTEHLEMICEGLKIEKYERK